MIPLSSAQLRLWFLERLLGPSPLYNVPFQLRLRGALDVAALVGAVGDVVGRHEVLRTVVVEDSGGVPFQRVVPVGEVALDVPVVEVAADRVAATVRELVSYRFDVSAEIPVRAWVLRVGPAEHVLVVVAHHIACDGESAGPFGRDVVAAYSARRAGGVPGWVELPVQYADYALWQREVSGEESDPDSVVAGQLAYWRRELAGVSGPVGLPVDRVRPAVAGHRGDVVEFVIAPRVLAGVERVAAARGATVSMVMQAALAVVVHQLGGGDDLTVGCPIAGRPDEALAELVGFFVNTWVLRVDVAGNPSFEELLGRVRGKALAAYDHQDVPFERLVEVLNPERSMAYHPLFQIMLAWQ
ncbi:MAG: nrps4-2, partial [Mycobacterium sp.]|nr:nrps4-2 [Mycobacterium sp.]